MKLKIFLSFLFPLFAAASLFGDGHLKFGMGGDPRFDWASYEAYRSEVDLTGQKLTLFGPWLGPDQELVESVIHYFEHATGAQVDYSGSDSFEQQINIDIQAGSPPNIAIFPQPGLAADVASKGGLTPLGEKTKDWVLENYSAGQSWVDLGTYKNKKGRDGFFGFFYKVDLKSLVWYVPDNFEEAGYEIPRTMEELVALSDRIVADGGTPWCIGLGSGDATGWPATDWVEDFMLRLNSPGDYDEWVTNRLAFDDPKVIKAIDAFGSFAKNDEYVDGGVEAVATTDFRDSPKGLFATPPKCYMHRQASFIPTFFPEGTELGVERRFLLFPPLCLRKLGQSRVGCRHSVRRDQTQQGGHGFHRFPETPHRPRNLDGSKRIPDSSQRRQFRGLRQRIPQETRRHPAQRHHLPLRRLRPDAGGYRRGNFLERHGRFHFRRIRRGSRQNRPKKAGKASSNPDGFTFKRRVSRLSSFFNLPLLLSSSPAVGDSLAPALPLVMQPAELFCRFFFPFSRPSERPFVRITIAS